MHLVSEYQNEKYISHKTKIETATVSACVARNMFWGSFHLLYLLRLETIL